MEAIPVAYAPLTRAAALRAGEAWRACRARGGPQDRVVADVRIGGHTALRADRLLTRGRGFGQMAHAGLVVLDPAAEPEP
jgi:predicted nucleic acid-binding protein